MKTLFATAFALIGLSLPTACSPAQENAETSAEEGLHKHTNTLVHETSPYLLQHAHNPVNWMPWGPEAFAKAQAENKPIFLSVGYSTCYWCHVMERESFEHEDVADIINTHYVPVKVDREERPEVDQQYMMATQLVTGRGGWPNSVWLTPEGKPWMAGTYFPKPQFKQVLNQLADAWKTRTVDVRKQSERLTSTIEGIGSGTVESKALSQELITKSVETALQRLDPEHGGFGKAPKFPPHAILALLIDQYGRDENPALLNAIETTLDKMSRGGVYDQLGGGFHRYSTDGYWLLPHFEKMLYDNGQLMRSYTDGYLLTKNARHREIVEGVHTWLAREMTSPEGGFYSAVDSESDAEEGKFYVWTYQEILEVLGKVDGELFARVYGVDRDGNFKEEATGHSSPNNVLHLATSLRDFANQNSLEPDQLNDQLTSMRSRLLSVRAKRKYPHLDDKVLAAWNGLMIKGLAYAGRQLNEPKYVDSAKRASDFILDRMIKDGKLQRTHRAGISKLNGYLNDYAFVSAGLIELYRATKDDKYLAATQQMADTVIRDFTDSQNGGFYFTAKPVQGIQSEFVIRSKNLGSGGNLPTGNGVMAQVLFDLADLTSEKKYADAANQTLKGMSGFLWQSAGQADALLVAVATALNQNRTATKVARNDTDAAFETKAVVGEVYFSRTRIKPGESFRLAVQLTIDERFHLYGPNSSVDFVKPTLIHFPDSNSAVVDHLTPPSGIKTMDKAIGRELETYEGRVTFYVDLKMPDNADVGTTPFSLSVITQACDDKLCMEPETSEVEILLTVIEPSESSTPPRHADIFTKQPKE